VSRAMRSESVATLIASWAAPTSTVLRTCMFS
jgi:hypothetical protein